MEDWISFIKRHEDIFQNPSRAQIHANRKINNTNGNIPYLTSQNVYSYDLRYGSSFIKETMVLEMFREQYLQFIKNIYYLALKISSEKKNSISREQVILRALKYYSKQCTEQFLMQLLINSRITKFPHGTKDLCLNAGEYYTIDPLSKNDILSEFYCELANNLVDSKSKEVVINDESLRRKAIKEFKLYKKN